MRFQALDRQVLVECDCGYEWPSRAGGLSGTTGSGKTTCPECRTHINIPAAVLREAGLRQPPATRETPGPAIEPTRRRPRTPLRPNRPPRLHHTANDQDTYDQVDDNDDYYNEDDGIDRPAPGSAPVGIAWRSTLDAMEALRQRRFPAATRRPASAPGTKPSTASAPRRAPAKRSQPPAHPGRTANTPGLTARPGAPAEASQSLAWIAEPGFGHVGDCPHTLALPARALVPVKVTCSACRRQVSVTGGRLVVRSPDAVTASVV
jgi:hypothetical protein